MPQLHEVAGRLAHPESGVERSAPRLDAGGDVTVDEDALSGVSDAIVQAATREVEGTRPQELPTRPEPVAAAPESETQKPEPDRKAVAAAIEAEDFEGAMAALASLRGLAVGDALGSQFFVPANYPLLKRRELPSGPSINVVTPCRT